MGSSEKVYDYLDHPPQRYELVHKSYLGDVMEEQKDGDWVKFEDMDLYMLEGGKLMQQMCDEHDRLLGIVREAHAKIALEFSGSSVCLCSDCRAASEAKP
jgi:hypothetical protein